MRAQPCLGSGQLPRMLHTPPSADSYLSWWLAYLGDLKWLDCSATQLGALGVSCLSYRLGPCNRLFWLMD